LYQPLFVCLSNWWPDPAVDLPIRLWSNACSPIVEAHVILWGHGHRRASADVAIARRHAAPGQRNGASRSLGAPQSRIGVPGGRATTRHPSFRLVKQCNRLASFGGALAHNSREPAEALDSSPWEAAALGTSCVGRRRPPPPREGCGSSRHPRRLQLPTEAFGCHLAGRCLRRRPHCNEATTIDPPSRSSRTPRRARHRRRRRRRHWRRRWWRRKRREGGCGPDHRVVDCRRLWATWKPIGDLGEIFFRDRLRPWAAVMGAIGERVSGHRRTWRRCRSIAAAYKKWLVL
jgi:hypothetical protein